MRVLSALNMAQADILGQSLGVPLYRLLGGKTRPQVRVYNTTTDYWAINNMKMVQLLPTASKKICAGAAIVPVAGWNATAAS